MNFLLFWHICRPLLLCALKINSSNQHFWAGELKLFAQDLAATSHVLPKDRNCPWTTRGSSSMGSCHNGALGIVNIYQFPSNNRSGDRPHMNTLPGIDKWWTQLSAPEIQKNKKHSFGGQPWFQTPARLLSVTSSWILGTVSPSVPGR